MAIITVFSERLREALDKSHLSQKEISKISKVSASSIQRWLNLENTPSIEHVESVAKALGVSVFWLLGGDGSNEKKASEIVSSIGKFSKVPPKILDMIVEVEGEHLWEQLEVTLQALTERTQEEREARLKTETEKT
ncbi:MAG: hypothetical protein Unbinned5081contig1003_22 [Prokaryotic dsDNA virus sp.]|nr:MAG: hypothetical protein Unbinned5081contig1003_22 [Prokaryotic dsDNA virus sp.]|tara:strand:+ start:4645 stop:5052 length:408 start_codon:yes stop_codon:yes gene_type:complete